MAALPSCKRIANHKRRLRRPQWRESYSAHDIVCYRSRESVSAPATPVLAFSLREAGTTEFRALRDGAGHEAGTDSIGVGRSAAGRGTADRRVPSIFASYDLNIVTVGDDQDRSIPGWPLG